MDHSPRRSRSRKARHKPNPRALFFAFLGLLLFSIGVFAVVLVGLVAPFGKSAYTQAHGLQRSGIVTSVANHEGRVDSADVGVRLAQPVAGQATTIAHVPGLVSLSRGATVRVLVDSQDPGYAELPRQQYIRKSQAQAGFIGGLALIVVSGSATIYAASAWRRRRRALSGPGGPLPVMT